MKKIEKTEQVEKRRFKEDYRIDTYRVDQNKIGKPSGLWQVMQEAACRQMEAQRPSYNDLLEAGQALMLARVDISIPEEVLADFVNQLPERYKMVFNLYVIEEMSHKDIAALLGINEGTSKSNLARAREILKRKVKEYLDHEQ